MKMHTSTNTETKTFEHDSIVYTTELSDCFDESSSSFGFVPDGPTHLTPPQRSPITAGDLIISPISPGRNIDKMVMSKTKVPRFDNRRTLLQRFKSISRRRKLEAGKNQGSLPLPAGLPLVQGSFSKNPQATTP